MVPVAPVLSLVRPLPPSAPAPALETAPAQAHSSRRTLALVGLGVGGLALAGAAVFAGSQLISGSEPAPAPATNLTMPAKVVSLDAITDPEIGTELVPLLGLGLRPSGATVTAAYGPKESGPLELAAMATTTAATGDPASEITTWAARTGATTGKPIVGTEGKEGVTCADASGIEGAPKGAFCVWSGASMRGQAYAIGADAQQALTMTAELRGAMPAPVAAAQ